MWRAGSLFGHTHIPDHHAVIHAQIHEAAEEHAPVLGHHDGHSLWGERTILCHICHAELQPHEETAGCCEDRDICCWRSLSERCW
jgi:hypothetical protein